MLVVGLFNRYIGTDNGLVPQGARPLAVSVLTKTIDIAYGIIRP